MDIHPQPWNETWDAAVVGCGLAGLAAAAACSRLGRRCLLLGPDGDLAWEWGRGFAGRLGDEGGTWWDAWCAWMADHGVPPLDPAQGEMAAHDLLAADPRSTWLGYAPPVAVERDGDRLASVIVAGKEGLRRIRAACWIDADGILLRLLGAAAPTPSTWQQHWLLRHADWPERLDAPRLPDGLETGWLPGARRTERRLRVCGPDPGTLAAAIPGVLAALRGSLPASCREAEVVAIASRCLPVPGGPAAVQAPATNLACAVPGWLGDAATSCRAGEAAARIACAAPPAGRWASDPPEPPTGALGPACTVLVAGWGTAGAIAAIAAAEAGADVLACDPSWMPGGIGTLGLVHGYCAGAAGGLHERIDAAARRLPFTSAGWTGPGWHPQAKSATLAEAMRTAGVRMLPGSSVVRAEVRDGGLLAVVLATPQGPLRVRCGCAIDATGDGDLCTLAGAEWMDSQRGDGGVLAFTQSAWMAGANGRLRGTNCDCGWVQADDSADLSRARSAGIRLFIAPAPRADGGYPVHLAPALGLRQSRHVRCDATVTLDDLARHRRHPDTVGTTASFLDTHASDQYAEADEVVVWQLLCRAFRAPLGGDLPYGMLLPRGLANVWVAGRAAGIAPDAAYALRMQRDMQRLGEAAGVAAALAARGGCASRELDVGELRRRLAASGALCAAPAPLPADACAVLDRGEESAALWPLFAEHPCHAAALRSRLGRGDRSGWLAAALLAAAGDAAAEPRLLAAIATRQSGPEPTDAQRGAFGQCIVLPDWALAAVLLRRCGTAACLPALEDLAGGDPCFDLRHLLALTVTALAARLEPCHATRLAGLADRLADLAPEAARLPASRSVRRRLLGEPDPPLPHVHHGGAEDLRWQLLLLRMRTRRLLDLDADPSILLADPRAPVRRQTHLAGLAAPAHGLQAQTR